LIWAGFLLALEPKDGARIMETSHIFIDGPGCSGIVIHHQRGFALTAEHCLPDSEMPENDFWVSMGPDDENKRMACLTQILARDKEYDLALLDISQCHPTQSVRVLRKGRDILAGQQVFIFGNPLGRAYRNSLSVGHVANPKRFSYYGPDHSENDIYFLQFSGGVWRGNSGGAIINKDGHLIGLVQALAIDVYMSYEERSVVRIPHIGIGIHRDTIIRFLSENIQAKQLNEALSR